MLSNSSIVAFVPVRDLGTAEEFFAGRLGLTVVERGAFALVVATASGQTIRCVPVKDATPLPFTILGWEVEDIHTAARDLRAAGVEPILYPQLDQDGDGVWSAPGSGARVMWFHDPDGNVLSLSQQQAKGPAGGTARAGMPEGGA